MGAGARKCSDVIPTQLGCSTRSGPCAGSSAKLRNAGFLLFDVGCDGQLLFDEGGALETCFASVRRRLVDRGARRVTDTGARYWMLEPDVGPGDVVVL